VDFMGLKESKCLAKWLKHAIFASSKDTSDPYSGNKILLVTDN
jgi:hypothetical protein